MYVEAYELLREILDDGQLQDYVYRETGKHLAVINAGAQITIPSARIVFGGGDITCSENISQDVRYQVEFALPFWGDNALERCHEFIDVAVKAFFEHEQRDNPIRVNRVIRLNPSITEQNEESELWTVAFEVTVSIFI